MVKDLERDLGLVSVLAISIGAMVGSGIFILPALAMEMAGSAVVLAYLLAGILVLPAALSKSEMATAMPEAGGTYVYIERSMGPLLGTIAGIGTWFALSFKGALALVGGAPYLVELVNLPARPVAIGLAAALIAVNLVGVKQTGRAQVAIVAVMLAAMGWFVFGSATSVEPVRFEGFYDAGTGGLLAATGFVFVSYAGVTKVASVAEEIENPGYVIPRGMLGSLAFTTALYVLVVAVLVGAAPTPNLAGSNTPVADVARDTMANPGFYAVVIAAILALVSTANAGLLSSSRYPFAMSRDGLVPGWFRHVSERFNTPTISVSVTGAILLGLIFVPIDDIAKLGSAFQILVFVLINVALVAFRESESEDYEPEFRDPLYPWTQAFGILGGLVLLTQMGTIPLVGAAVIVVASTVWYLGYASRRVRREGVARDEIRRRVGRRAVEQTRSAVDDETTAHSVVVGVTEDTDLNHEETLVRLAAAVAEGRDSRIEVVRFDEVPDQLPLEPAMADLSAGDEAFEERMHALEADLPVQLEYGEIVSHDLRHAIVNFADHHEADLIVIEDVEDGMSGYVFEEDDEWIATHAPCDVALVDPEGLGVPETLALVTDNGPFDPFKVEIADALATDADASLVLIQGLRADATDQQRDGLAAYHEELADLVSVPVESRIVETDGGDALLDAAGEADLVIVEGEPVRLDRLVGHERLEDRLAGPTVVLRPHRSRTPGVVGRVLERLAF